MISVGIDCGSQNTKGVLLQDGKMLAKASAPTAFDANQAAESVYTRLLEESHTAEDAVNAMTVTGTGRALFHRSGGAMNEVASAARGIRWLHPETELVIDMGADSCRVIRFNEDGTIMKYEVNDKCASGAGTFIETMARALQIRTEEMGDYSQRHTKELVTNAQCVVFAESEVISLIHSQETVEDIAYGIHMGIVNRVASMVRRVGLPKQVSFSGGPGHNAGLLACIARGFDREIWVSPDTEYVSAIGAALSAAEEANTAIGTDGRNTSWM